MESKGLAHEIVQDFMRVSAEMGRHPSRDEYIKVGKFSKRTIVECFGSWTKFILAIGAGNPVGESVSRPIKVLVFDIETAPMLVWSWGLYDQNHGVNQIYSDGFILSVSAKWLGSEEIFYKDQRNSIPIRDDLELLKWIWEFLNEADVVLTQNGKKFDQKKLNERFALLGMKPPSSFKHIDTKLLAKKYFALPSNSLEYMSERFCVKYKKLTHKQFPGFSLWIECMKGNIAAFMEMEIYNKHDVLALEELYFKLAPWDSSVNFNLYTNENTSRCSCSGEYKLLEDKYYTTASGRFYLYSCEKCGSEVRGRENLLSKQKKESLRMGTKR